MRKHGKFREKGTNFVTGNLEEQNPNAERAARSTKVSLRKVGTREEKGMGAWAAPREDELGKVRYKPEELGLYIDDPHATLKPELQRHQIYNLASSDYCSSYTNLGPLFVVLETLVKRSGIQKKIWTKTDLFPKKCKIGFEI